MRAPPSAGEENPSESVAEHVCLSLPNYERQASCGGADKGATNNGVKNLAMSESADLDISMREKPTAKTPS